MRRYFSGPLSKLFFFTSLEQLTTAGLSLRDSLYIISTATRGRSQKWVQSCYEKLEEGQIFSQVLSSSSYLADPTSLSLIRVGEQTGEMAQAFHLICLHVRQAQVLNQQWQKAIRYPCIVLLVMSLTVWTLCETLLPSLLRLVTEAGGEVPLITKGLFFLSDLIQRKGVFYVKGLFLCLGILWMLWHFLSSARLLLERLLLACPYVGTLYLDLTWARFFCLKRLMMSQNIPFLDAFDTAATAIPWRSLQKPLIKTREQILEGHSLAASYSDLPGITSATLYLLKMALQTGLLTPTFKHISELYQQAAQKRQEQFLGFLEPICLGILGLLLFLVISATLLPLYDQIQTMGGLSE